MNGIEVLEAMAAAGIGIGVIMLSSLTVRGGEMTVRALELGAFDFLTKPEGGSAETNRGLLRARLLPMIRAFESRREIRAILSGAKSRPAPPAALPALSAATVARQPFVRSPHFGSTPGADWCIHRRSRRLDQTDALTAGRSGSAGIHRPAYAGDVYPAPGCQPG